MLLKIFRIVNRELFDELKFPLYFKFKNNNIKILKKGIRYEVYCKDLIENKNQLIIPFFLSDSFLFINSFKPSYINLVKDILNKGTNIKLNNINFDNKDYIKYIQNAYSVLNIRIKSDSPLLDYSSFSGSVLKEYKIMFEDVIKEGKIESMKFALKGYNNFLLKLINDGRISIIPEPKDKEVITILNLLLTTK